LFVQKRSFVNKTDLLIEPNEDYIKHRRRNILFDNNQSYLRINT